MFPERFPVAALLPGGEGPGPLLAHLREHGWAVLRDTEAGAALAADVSAACSAFFGEDDDAKKRHAQSCPGKIGKLHMWGAGYSRQRVREQFHIVVVRRRPRAGPPLWRTCCIPSSSRCSVGGRGALQLG